MNYKNLITVINDKDIRPVFLAILSGIMERHYEKVAQKTNHIQSYLELETGGNSILKSIVEINRVFNETNKELENLASIALLLTDKASPPDTEVLKDLSNLHEDGLGVDDGSE